MKASVFSALVLCMAVTTMGATPAAFAASDAQKAQQARFGDCSHQAKMKGLKGTDFKSFMKSCASGSAPATSSAAKTSTATTTTAPSASSPDKRMTQQDRMKQCNSDAKMKDLHGDARKNFMKSCLSS